MAPELLRGTAPSPASDWYSAGAMVYEALTGGVPYRGAASAMLLERARAAPPWPADTQGSVPIPLLALVSRLLDPDPARRPSGAEVLAALDRLEAEAATRTTFVGRAPEMALLRANLERVRGGHATLVHVLGPSGIGKTELIARFLDPLGPDDALVLRGRCLTQESLPYKAFDAVVDELSEHLARQPPEALAALPPSTIGALARLFPVLEPFTAKATGERHDVAPDPQEGRRQGFAAFRDLLTRLAAERPLVVWIDDLQWSDLDSVALLSALLQDAPPPLLLVLSYRSEEREQMLWLDRLEADTPATLSVQTLPLGPLTPEDAETLARAACPPALRSAARIAAIVAEADGSPFFVGELARAVDLHDGTDAAVAGPRLSDAIVRRAWQLPVPAREVLEIVCLAGHTVERRTVLAALGIGERGRPLVAQLEHGHFLRVTSLDGTPALQAYHDRIREAVVAQLSSERQRHWHKRLAEALRRSADPELLFEHYRAAGDDDLAGAYAAEAAERASRTLAFDRAADLWAEVLRLQPEAPERWRFLAQRAEALTNAGRRRGAAEAFEAAANALAARAPADPARLTLQRRAAEHYLRSGLIDKGLVLTRDILAEVGVRLPSSPRGTLADSIAQRLRLLWRGVGFTLRDTAAPAADLQRLEVCWGTMTSLSVVDPGLNDGLAIKYLIAALDVGERSHLMHALGQEACREAAVGGRYLRRRSGKLLSIAEGLSDGSVPPYDRAIQEFNRGATAYFAGHWRAAAEAFQAATTILRTRCTGVSWEIATAEIFAATALARMGRFRALAAFLPAKIAEADGRQDLHAGASLRVGLLNLAWLVLDEPLRARREAADAVADIPGNLFPVLHVLHALGDVHVDLYVGDAAGAWQHAQDSWRLARRAHLLFLELFQVDFRCLRARAAVAFASTSSGEGRTSRPTRTRLLRQAEADARVLARRTFACGVSRAAAIRAAVAALRGDRDRSMALLAVAQAGFAGTDMMAHAAAAARALSMLRRDGRHAEADAALEAEGVRHPAALAGVLVPGPWTSER
jgi:tetratricopeptide (TPR) repeat protein